MLRHPTNRLTHYNRRIAIAGASLAVLAAAAVAAIVIAGCGGEADNSSDATGRAAQGPTATATLAAGRAGQGSTATATLAAATAVSVRIPAIVYSPGTVNVSVGDTVTWTMLDRNQGVVGHTVSSDMDGLFDSGQLSIGQTFSFTFTQPGTFGYHCNIHFPMEGKIVVAAAASDPR